MTVQQIAYHHIIAKLDSQRADIRNLRNQASISAAVSGLIATVFASLVGSGGKIGPLVEGSFLGFSPAAFILFCVFGTSIAFAILVVIDWHEFTFAFDTEKMLEIGAQKGSEEAFYESYVTDGEWFFRDNEKKIELAQSRLWWAMVLGWAQIIPWIVLIQR